jgi:DnaJ-class molecular chaperone
MTASEVALKALREAAQLQQSQEPTKEAKARLRQVCPHCNGAGKVPLDQKSGRLVPCSGCDGKGYR